MNHLIRPLLPLMLSAALAVPASAQTHADHGVAVQGAEYTFSPVAPLPTGWTRFTFTNTGKELHHYQIARLPDGMTLEQFGAELKAKGEAATAQIEFVGGVGILPPGTSGTSYVKLDRPGLYVELCFVPDAKGVPHLALGMVSAFEVTAGPGSVSAAPRAAVQVSLEDYGIKIPKGIKAGPQVWQLTNKGPEPHEMMIFKMLPGKTVDDLMAMFANPAAAPAGQPMGGMQALARGRTGYVELNLEPGEYLLFCGIPSPTHNGQSHLALGMVRPFTVK